MDYYLFLDESGDHGLSNIDAGFPVFILCGIIISQGAYDRIDGEVNALKSRIFGRDGVVLHSVDIRRQRRGFQSLAHQPTREDFLRSLSGIMSEADYTIIASAINKKDYIEQYGRLSADVYELSLSFIIERAVFYLDTILDPNKRLRIIIERRGTKEDKKLDEHFQRLKAWGTYYVRAERIRSIVDINFRKKDQNITGLQLSDLAAYPIARYIIDPRKDNPSFDVIKPKFYQKDGKNYGLKIFP